MTFACSSRRRFIFVADARASELAGCCRAWAMRRLVRFSRNAGRSKYAATSVIAPMYSMWWMLRNCSMRAWRATAAALCTEATTCGGDDPRSVGLTRGGTLDLACRPSARLQRQCLDVVEHHLRL